MINSIVFPALSRARMTFAHTPLQSEVAALLVEALNLDIAPETIDPEAPLYGEGLGLDSIDILEVALVVSQRYGFQLRSDDEDNVRIFTSLASLAEHIARATDRRLGLAMRARIVAVGLVGVGLRARLALADDGAPASPWNAVVVVGPMLGAARRRSPGSAASGCSRRSPRSADRGAGRAGVARRRPARRRRSTSPSTSPSTSCSRSSSALTLQAGPRAAGHGAGAARARRR